VIGVASCGPYPDSQMAALMSEVAFGKVLIRKVFEAPADSPNKRTFVYCGIVSIISKDQGMASRNLPGFLRTR
jgi:hypothetical protein